MPTKEVTCTKTAWVQLVRNDADRIELRLTNIDGTNRVNVAPRSDTPPGYPILANSELPLNLKDSEAAQMSWWCYAPVAAVTVSVYEGYGEAVDVSAKQRTRELLDRPKHGAGGAFARPV